MSHCFPLSGFLGGEDSPLKRTEFPQRLWFSGETEQPQISTLPVIIGEVLQPADHLHGILLIHSSSFTSFLYQSPQCWMQHFRWSFMNREKKRKKEKMYNTMQAESRKLESLIFRADGE